MNYFMHASCLVVHLFHSAVTELLLEARDYIQGHADAYDCSNEKQNQLIRWFFPKGTDFRKVTQKEVRRVQDWINNYPRLILDWHTSAELFNVFLASL